jgi:PAS domain S-box-containing protein
MDFLSHLFDASGFTPRWECGLWTPALGWLHILSDLGIWTAYFGIPVILVYFVLRRRDLPFPSIFWLFGAFILACGTTHLMEAVIFWHPLYRLAGVIKLITAGVSWATVIALIPTIPRALAMRSPEELEREIATRQEAERSLQQANAELERRVEERTAELVRANAALQKERDRFRITLASIGDAVITTDPSGQVTMLNPVAEALTGWPGKEAIGRSLDVVFPIANGATGAPAENPIARVMREGTVVGLANHTVLTARDGTKRPIDDSAAPIKDEDGQTQGCILVFHDVTEKRQAERALVESEQRFSRFMQQVPGLAWIKDLKGRYVFANDAALRAFRRSREQLYGQTDAEVFSPATAAQFVENDRRALESGTGVSIIEALEHDDGVVHVSVVNKFPISGPDDQSTLLGGIAIDITERRQAEKALQESEEKFRLMADNIPPMAWMARPDGSVFWYNRRWYDYTGTTPEQMEGWGGQSVHDPLERPRVMERWHASLDQGEPFEMVFPLRGADGKFRTFLTRIVPLRGADGAIRYWFGTNADITEIKATEEGLRQRIERLRLLHESAAHLLYADNPDGMVRGLFERVKDHLGVDTYLSFMVTEAEDALQMESCAGIPEQEAARITRLEFGQAICGTVALERRPLAVDHIQQSDDPKVQLVKRLGIDAYACNPLIAEDRLLGTLSFASHTRDHFNNDELEFIQTLCHYVTVAYERLRLVKELRDADRRKDEFLAMLAHELRNPLAPIRNALQILRMRNADGVTAERAREMMERQLQHLVRLVDDLLDVSRIMRSKIELRKEVADLRQVVERAVDIAQPILDAHGHKLSIVSPPEPLLVEGDSVRLAQVVANLLNNAAKFTERSGRIWLNLERQGTEAVLRVKDNGVGISPGLLPKIFELFVQGDRSIARTQGGLGIGLTLVKRLVEMHNGTVAAFSAGEGKGSEFVVRVPVVAAADERRDAGNGDDAAIQARRRRVLVVDDNADAAESLALFLRMRGHEVRTTYDGPSALEMMPGYQPDLVLLDIGLPGMDGYEVARRIRLMPEGRSVRIVAVTGYGQDEDRRLAQEAGFDQHLTKPVDPEALESLIGS